MSSYAAVKKFTYHFLTACLLLTCALAAHFLLNTLFKMTDNVSTAEDHRNTSRFTILLKEHDILSDNRFAPLTYWLTYHDPGKLLNSFRSLDFSIYPQYSGQEDVPPVPALSETPDPGQKTPEKEPVIPVRVLADFSSVPFYILANSPDPSKTPEKLSGFQYPLWMDKHGNILDLGEIFIMPENSEIPEEKTILLLWKEDSVHHELPREAHLLTSSGNRKFDLETVRAYNIYANQQENPPELVYIYWREEKIKEPTLSESESDSVPDNTEDTPQ